MRLVVVESPAKAKTINKYLGDEYNVVASYGHIRGLPSKKGSVDPNQDFTMVYEILDKSAKHVKSIANLAKKADSIYLATDPDREGEAISWHIIETLKEQKALKEKIKIKRVVFNEITKRSVSYAVENPREIDINLVNAQQARTALDYLVGFTLSPVLWKKLPGSKSAGRVQSVALRMICEREAEIENFVSREYWDIKLDFNQSRGEKFTATLTHHDKKKLEKFDIQNKQQSEAIIKELQKKYFIVKDIESKQLKRNPQPPFTTSSLQQEASRKLGFSTKKTMQLAQKLYEGVDINGESTGLITYMRTDAVTLSQESIVDTRELIKKSYGEKYLPKEARVYKTKAKNAQEAHEAIRPTNIIKFIPSIIEDSLEKDMFKLYELIWKRTLACQMENAILDQVIVNIESDDKKDLARATGSTLKFDGFYKIYREGLDDEQDEEYKILPKLEKDDKLSIIEIRPNQHFTEPPPRFTEASLVKKLEELGIGRPSTYASIISVLQERNYVKLEKKRFIPEDRGMVVTSFLVNFFKKYVEYDFTAQLEDQLDNISSGDLNWKEMLSNFWQDFITNINKASEAKNTDIIESINQSLENHFFKKDEKGNVNKNCPLCSIGTLSIKLGRYGAFYSCSGYPECNYIKSIESNNQEQDKENQDSVAKFEDKVLGKSDIGEDILLKKGPYGYYVQTQVQGAKKSTKPKRCSVPSYIMVDMIDLEKAKTLLSLPLTLGKYENKEITFAIGRFGPFITYDEGFISVDKNEEIFSINLEKAVILIHNKKNGAKNDKATKKNNIEPIAKLGYHPKENLEINLFTGRYGPYIKYKKYNISIPKKYSIEIIDLETAVNLIEEYVNKKN